MKQKSQRVLCKPRVEQTASDLVEAVNKLIEENERLEEAVYYLSTCIEAGSWVSTEQTIIKILDPNPSHE